jgi:hypothetical protein
MIDFTFHCHIRYLRIANIRPVECSGKSWLPILECSSPPDPRITNALPCHPFLSKADDAVKIELRQSES